MDFPLEKVSKITSASLTIIIVAVILASPKHRVFTWGYCSSIYKVRCSGLMMRSVTCINCERTKMQRELLEPIRTIFHSFFSEFLGKRIFKVPVFKIFWGQSPWTPLDGRAFHGSQSRPTTLNYAPRSPKWKTNVWATHRRQHSLPRQ